MPPDGTLRISIDGLKLEVVSNRQWVPIAVGDQQKATRLSSYGVYRDTPEGIEGFRRDTGVWEPIALSLGQEEPSFFERQVEARRSVFEEAQASREGQTRPISQVGTTNSAAPNNGLVETVDIGRPDVPWTDEQLGALGWRVKTTIVAGESSIHLNEEGRLISREPEPFTRRIWAQSVATGPERVWRQFVLETLQAQGRLPNVGEFQAFENRNQPAQQEQFPSNDFQLASQAFYQTFRDRNSGRDPDANQVMAFIEDFERRLTAAGARPPSSPSTLEQLAVEAFRNVTPNATPEQVLAFTSQVGDAARQSVTPDPTTPEGLLVNRFLANNPEASADDVLQLISDLQTARTQDQPKTLDQQIAALLSTAQSFDASDPDFARAQALFDFGNQPDRLDLLDRALEIARAPGDLITLMQMYRGQVPLGPLPPSRAFDLVPRIFGKSPFAVPFAEERTGGASQPVAGQPHGGRVFETDQNLFPGTATEGPPPEARVVVGQSGTLSTLPSIPQPPVDINDDDSIKRYIADKTEGKFFAPFASKPTTPFRATAPRPRIIDESPVSDEPIAPKRRQRGPRFEEGMATEDQRRAGFEHGGVVDGDRIGDPVDATVHVGETIRTPSQEAKLQTERARMSPFLKPFLTGQPLGQPHAGLVPTIIGFPIPSASSLRNLTPVEMETLRAEVERRHLPWGEFQDAFRRTTGVGQPFGRRSAFAPTTIRRVGS